MRSNANIKIPQYRLMRKRKGEFMLESILKSAEAEKIRLTVELQKVNEIIAGLKDDEVQSVEYSEGYLSRSETVLQAIVAHPGLKVGEIAKVIARGGIQMESNEVSRHVFYLKTKKSAIKEKHRRYWLVASKESEIIEAKKIAPTLIKSSDIRHSAHQAF